VDAPPLSIKLSPAAVEPSVVVQMPLATAASFSWAHYAHCLTLKSEMHATLDASSKDEVTEKKMVKITN
jgi:hypothetical protein